MKETYIGPLKVEFVTDNGDGTVEVKYTNDTKEVLMKKTFDIVSCDKQQDWNYVQDEKFLAMSKDILEVIRQYDLKWFEINGLMSYLLKELKGRFDRAVNFMWTKDDTQFVANTDPTATFSVLQAEKIIKDIPDGTLPTATKK